MFTKKKSHYEPDRQRIFELVKQLDDSISYETVSEIIDGCTDEEEKKFSPEDHPAVIQARKIIEQKRFDDDLRRIREEYPQETAKSVWEFDEPFISLVMTGIVDALTAYEAYIAAKNRMKKKHPPSTGSAGGGAFAGKEYFTPEEVDRLTDRDYENPAVVKAVRNSMLRW